jgi:hypothetical protein
VRESNHSTMDGVVYAMHGDPGIRRISGQMAVGSSGNTIVFPTPPTFKNRKMKEGHECEK